MRSSPASVFVAKLLTQELAGSVARLLFRLLYRVEAKGLENYRAAGRKAVIIANHSSFLDGPLLSAFLPERASFAINSHSTRAAAEDLGTLAQLTVPNNLPATGFASTRSRPATSPPN